MIYLKKNLNKFFLDILRKKSRINIYIYIYFGKIIFK